MKSFLSIFFFFFAPLTIDVRSGGPVLCYVLKVLSRLEEQNVTRDALSELSLWPLKYRNNFVISLRTDAGNANHENAVEKHVNKKTTNQRPPHRIWRNYESFVGGIICTRGACKTGRPSEKWREKEKHSRVRRDENGKRIRADVATAQCEAQRNVSKKKK